VWTRWTTRCCSAVALLALGSPTPLAQSGGAENDPVAARSLFPVRPLWSLPLNNQLAVAPVYDDRQGYFAIERDRIAAYELNTGTRTWLVSASPVMPLAAGEALVFVVEAEALRALRADDGSTAWSVPFAEALAAPPVWDNGWLVVATALNDVLAFRAADGELIWRTPIAAAAHAPPALAADRVYIPTDDGRVVALMIATGAIVWERRLGGPANDVLALDERLYVGSQDNYFYCLLTGDGRIDWRWRTGADVIGRAVIDHDLVYFVSLDNVIRALHHARGAQRWRTAMPVRPTAGPVKAGDALIVPGIGRSMPAYALSDGRPVGELTVAGEPAAGAPHVHLPRPEGLPVVITVGRELAKGATVTAVTRSTEPPVAPLKPLPNAAPIRPVPAVGGAAADP
jgi:outer membrane protein assembly factor BamB